MATFERVPVVDVQTDNFKEIWPSLILAMSSSTFVALDTELSGLGPRKMLNSKSVEDRYKTISNTAKTRSILALGISCFKLQTTPLGTIGKSETVVGSQSNLAGQSGDLDSQGDPKATTQSNMSQSGDTTRSQSKESYMVQTFNITVLCEEDYIVEPGSLKFLVQHGFDFNRQYDKGVSYYRGNDKPADNSIQSIRHLFVELVSMKVPIVVHNGLMDLMFLYQNLYCNLPAISASFLADLVDLFPSGIVDTKYVTDFEHLMPASYLEYVFRKCQRDNSQNPSGCEIHFPPYPARYPHVSFRECQLKRVHDFTGVNDPRVLSCDTYTGHGWCTKGKYCPKSHDIDLIIDIDEFCKDRKSRKRKRRKQNQQRIDSQSYNDSADMDLAEWNSDFTEMSVGDAAPESDCKDIENKTDRMEIDGRLVNKAKTIMNCAKLDQDFQREKENGHKFCENCGRADAVLSAGGHRAGYDAFMTGLIYAVYQTTLTGDERERKIGEWKNKLYLSAKDYPLTVSKSNFVKQSKEHLEKLARIRRSNTVQAFS